MLAMASLGAGFSGSVSVVLQSEPSSWLPGSRPAPTLIGQNDGCTLGTVLDRLRSCSSGKKSSLLSLVSKTMLVGQETTCRSQKKPSIDSGRIPKSRKVLRTTNGTG